MGDLKRLKLAEIIEAALELAEEAGPTTPESRAIVIAAALDAVYRHHPVVVRTQQPVPTPRFPYPRFRASGVLT